MVTHHPSNAVRITQFRLPDADPFVLIVIHAGCFKFVHFWAPIWTTTNNALSHRWEQRLGGEQVLEVFGLPVGVDAVEEEGLGCAEGIERLALRLGEVDVLELVEGARAGGEGVGAEGGVVG